MIRVGRCLYDRNGNVTYPTYENFTPVIVVMKSHSKYYPLSPYFLKDSKGCIMENIWQFSKIYKTVPETTQKYSRYDQTIIWDYKTEKHIDTDSNILPGYWTWRKKGMNNKYPVRYPVGYKNMSKCAYAIPNHDPNLKLDYIDARRKIYIPLYCELAKADRTYFSKLKSRLAQGENLLIIEPDGPHQESLGYYQSKYNVEDDFIESYTMLVTEENITIIAFDDSHAFGHGYCLAMALLDMDYLIDFWDDLLDGSNGTKTNHNIIEI